MGRVELGTSRAAPRAAAMAADTSTAQAKAAKSRGRGWARQECKDLALAWGKATTNSILGADQSAAVFHSAIYAFYTDANPLYKSRALAPVIRKWKVIAADVQRFSGCLEEVKGFAPTGTTEDNLLSMACARHLDRYKPNSHVAEERNMYAFANFDTGQWSYFDAYMVLRVYEKFKPGGDDALIVGDSNEGLTASATGGAATAGARQVESEAPGEEAFAATIANASASAADTSPERRGGRGRKSAKAYTLTQRRQEAALKQMTLIGETMKRKAEAFEEANNFLLFRIPIDGETAEDKAFKAQYLRAARKKRLIREGLISAPSPTQLPAAHASAEVASESESPASTLRTLDSDASAVDDSTA